MDGGSAPRVIAGGITLSQVNNTFLRVDGANAATGNIDLGSNKLINVADPTDLQDVATKNYVDGKLPSSDTTAFGPAFSVYALGAQAIPANVTTQVKFPAVKFDPDDCLVNLNRFFPQKAGCYIVTAYVEFRNNSAEISSNVGLYKSGGLYALIAGGGGTAAVRRGVTGTTLVRLTNTDYLEIFITSVDAENIMVRDFSAAYLRP